MAIPSQKTNGGDARGTGRTASREARKSTEAPSKPTAGADIKGKAKKKTTDDKATLPAAEELCEYRQTDWRGGGEQGLYALRSCKPVFTLAARCCSVLNAVAGSLLRPSPALRSERR